MERAWGVNLRLLCNTGIALLFHSQAHCRLSKGVTQECRVKKVQSVLSPEVATIAFIPVPPVLPLNHIYL